MSPAQPADPTMTVVDCQWHWYPPTLLERHVGRSAKPRAIPNADGYTYEVSDAETWEYDHRFTDLDHQVETMDRAGIDMAVISCAVAGDVSERDPQEGREICELLNEEMSHAQSKHPGRIAGLAHLPLNDTAVALELLDDAVGRLGLRGIWLPGNVAGMSVADESLAPVYARAEQLDLPLFLHPTRSFRQPSVSPFGLEIPIGYMFDTSFASMSLIASGVLDRHPDLRIVHPHAGGTLPYLHGRIEVYRQKGWWPGLERPIVDYLRQMWFDTVCNQPETLQLLIDVVGVERIMFSSDYPYWSPRKGLELVRNVVADSDLAAVLGGTALSVLGPERTPALP